MSDRSMITIDRVKADFSKTFDQVPWNMFLDRIQTVNYIMGQKRNLIFFWVTQNISNSTCPKPIHELFPQTWLSLSIPYLSESILYIPKTWQTLWKSFLHNPMFIPTPKPTNLIPQQLSAHVRDYSTAVNNQVTLLKGISYLWLLWDLFVFGVLMLH